MKALVTADFDERGLELLRRHMEVVYEPWIETGAINRGEEYAERIVAEEIDVLVVETDLVHEEVFETGRIKIVGVCRGDPLTVDVDEATDGGVPVFHTPGRNAPAVADHTLALLLTLTRKVVHADRAIRAGEFKPESLQDISAFYTAYRGSELGGKRVALIGFGQVAVEVAKRLTGFGANIAAFDPYAPAERFEAHGVERAEDVRALVASADIVSIHCPESRETRRLFDAELLGVMKPGALLVNTARASIVDEAALHEALSSGRLAGAALDVLKCEPLRVDDPLLQLPNVVVTPHTAGASGEVVERQSEMIAGDIDRYLRGEQPRHCVNPEVLAK